MKNPCWKGYKMVGKKEKGGKTVPNCVPFKEGLTFINYLNRREKQKDNE